MKKVQVSDRRWLSALLVVLVITAVGLSDRVLAQCSKLSNPTTANVMTATNIGVCGGGMSGMILSVMTSLRNCTATVGVNVAACNVMGVFGSPTTLYAVHCSTSATPVQCAFNCTGSGTCGSFTWENATGLPVELLEFSVAAVDDQQSGQAEPVDERPEQHDAGDNESTGDGGR